MQRGGSAIQNDFDRIAQALDRGADFDYLQPWERALLTRLPKRYDRVLDVGCGHGALTRALADRADSVIALDVSPAMIHVARKHSLGRHNIEYVRADVLAYELPEAMFDIVVCVATLHHLPFTSTVHRLANAVRPGGLLLIQDVVTRTGLRYVPTNALAWITRCLRSGWSDLGAEVTALYREHGRDEIYLTPAEASIAFANVLPGASVEQHLEWRYTAVWHCAPAT